MTTRKTCITAVIILISGASFHIQENKNFTSSLRILMSSKKTYRDGNPHALDVLRTLLAVGAELFLHFVFMLSGLAYSPIIFGLSTGIGPAC
jgi:hypothetical protein